MSAAASSSVVLLCFLNSALSLLRVTPPAPPPHCYWSQFLSLSSPPSLGFPVWELRVSVTWPFSIDTYIVNVHKNDALFTVFGKNTTQLFGFVEAQSQTVVNFNGETVPPPDAWWYLLQSIIQCQNKSTRATLQTALTLKLCVIVLRSQ